MLAIRSYSSYSCCYTGYLKSVKSSAIPAKDDTNITVTDESVSHRCDMGTEQHQKLLGGFISSPLLDMESIVDMGINDWQNEQMIGSYWLSIGGNIHGISSYMKWNKKASINIPITLKILDLFKFIKNSFLFIIINGDIYENKTWICMRSC